MRHAPRQRLFFALWPDDALREALTKIAKKVLRKQGRRVPPENLHITLVFLGAVDPAQRRCAEQVAGCVNASPFTLRLDHLGHWPRTRVAWSAPAQIPSALTSLVRELNDGLTACGFTPDARPYRAHLTLARKVVAGVPDAPHEVLDWRVEEFHLVESLTLSAGVSYRVLDSWALRGETKEVWLESRKQ